LLGVGLYALSQHHFNRMVEGRRRAAELQNRILEAALRQQMLEQHAHGSLIPTILREVGSQPEVQGVMILDHDGIVRQASREALVGERFSRESAACLVCHRIAPAARDRWAVLDLPGGEVLRSVQPIENRPECYGCHSPEKRLNGILILDVSLASVQAQISRDRRWMAVGNRGAGVPVARQHRSHRATTDSRPADEAGGDGPFHCGRQPAERADVVGDDTISGLAAEFNDMADAPCSSSPR